MSIIQFFRILWAYRLMILLSTLVTLVAGTLTVELVKPRYEAASRVMLDVIKPDPVTGQIMSTAFLRAYTKTQIELIKDQQVASHVVDNLKWGQNPRMKQAFAERKGGKDQDFTRWATQKVVDGSDAQLIQGSNILEITFSSSSPQEAMKVADALRDAYVQTTLNTRREAARRNAEWYEAQATKAKGILFQAEQVKSAFERANGIVLQDDKMDVDSARLAALAQQNSAPMVAPQMATTSVAATQLAQLDAELAEAGKSLGPNHPQLQQLRIRRGLLAGQVAQERSNANTSAGAALSAANATAGLLEQQKAKVMGQRDKVERLRLMQDEIDLRRDQYNKAVTRGAQLRQEAEVAEAGVVPLANATTPQSPIFPKKGLIMGASIPAGAAIGIVLALMAEIFGRRIRSAQDLGATVKAPVLAVIQNPLTRKRRGWASLWPFRVRAPGLRSRAARA